MVLFSQFLNTKYHCLDEIGVDMDDLPVNSEKTPLHVYLKKEEKIAPNISVAVSGS